MAQAALAAARTRRNVERTEQKEAEATKLQEAAYGAPLAAGLPVTDLAIAVLISADGTIHHRFCVSYIHALQRRDWYAAAFTGYTGPVTVAGGKGRSSADAARESIKIGSADRHSVRECEHACLHELAHIVTPDRGAVDSEPRL